MKSRGARRIVCGGATDRAGRVLLHRRPLRSRSRGSANEGFPISAIVEDCRRARAWTGATEPLEGGGGARASSSSARSTSRGRRTKATLFAALDRALRAARALRPQLGRARRRARGSRLARQGRRASSRSRTRPPTARTHPNDWATLEEILGEAAEFWRERHVPFWVVRRLKRRAATPAGRRARSRSGQRPVAHRPMTLQDPDFDRWSSSTRTDLDVLLLERADFPGYWQSVTGSQEPGETLAETAARELAEETGIDADACGGRRRLELLERLRDLPAVAAPLRRRAPRTTPSTCSRSSCPHRCR